MSPFTPDVMGLLWQLFPAQPLHIDKKKCFAFDCISSGQIAAAVYTEIKYCMQYYFSSVGYKANHHIAMSPLCIKPQCRSLHSRTGRERGKTNSHSVMVQYSFVKMKHTDRQ